MKKGIEEKRPAEDRQCRRPLHTLVRGRGSPGGGGRGEGGRGGGGRKARQARQEIKRCRWGKALELNQIPHRYNLAAAR